MSRGKKSVLLVMVRHGETVANVEGVYQGQGFDTALTAVGEMQAASAGQALSGVLFSKFLCSDLARTRKTAEIIACQAGGIIPVDQFQYEVKLREKAFGVLEGFPREMTIEDAKKAIAEREGKSIEEVVDDKSESNLDLKERQAVFIKSLVADKSIESGSKILAVTHGRFIKEFIANCLQVPYDDVVKISNCSFTGVNLTIGEIDPSAADPWGRVKVVENGINNNRHITGGGADELTWLRQ